MLEIQKQAAPLRRQVLDSLRQSIIAGQLAPGQRLTERELTQMMEVSRTVIREALRQLETEGLIEIIPNTGPVVRKLTAAEAKDLYRIRAVLEGLTARLFVENATKEQIKHLGDALEIVIDAYRQGDAEKILEYKNKYYDALYEGANSESLGSMLAMLHARIWRWRALGLTHPKRSAERSRESIKNLRAILTAIKKRNAEEAERITIEEAHKAAEEVMRLLASDKPEG
jgi:DNA-binding GntR family transcriptional regulator